MSSHKCLHMWLSSNILLHLSGCTFTSLVIKHLHNLWVSQGGKVTQVLLVAGHLSENSPHDLPFMDNRRRKWQQLLPCRGSACWLERLLCLLPERVFGSPGAFWIKSGVAIGPIFSLTEKKTQNFAFLFTYLTCNRKKKDLKFDKFSNNNLREVSAEMLKICFLPRFMKTEETKELHLSVITVSVTFNHNI